MSHDIKYILYLLYLVLLVFTVVRIILDTHSSSKALAYILLVILLPLAGILFYFSFGVNYRHLKMTEKGIEAMHELTASIKKYIPDRTNNLIQSSAAQLGQYTELAAFIHKIGIESLCENQYQLLVNGEEKFPEVLRVMETAVHFIHLEYYDWENDTRGNQIKEVLLRKARQGVKVRAMFDAYASRKIRHNIVKTLQAGGVDIYPVIPIRITFMANRFNHRDHWKVIIVDGHTGFLGGINISDRYDNSIDTGLYWRDTHVKITGPGVLNMQRHFIIHWNACQEERLVFNDLLFPYEKAVSLPGPKEMGQVVAGGPIFPMSNIMLSYFRIFTLAKDKLYITNPYFIPNDSILDSLKGAAISGVDVRLLMPEKSDSFIVGAASRF